MGKRIFTKPIFVALLSLVCCALWGSAFAFIKLGYREFDISESDVGSQVLFAGLRFFCAGVIAVAAGSVFEKRFVVPKKNSIGKIILLGLVATAVQYTLFYIGLAHTGGMKGSVIISLNVFFSILIACFVYKMEKFTLKKAVGCLIGFLGVVIINIDSSFNFDFNLLGDGLIVLSAAAYALSSVMCKRYSAEETPLTLTSYQFLIGGAVMILFGALSGGKVSGWTLKSSLIFIYLALLSAAAYMIWSVLLKYNPVARVSVYGFSNPIFGVLFCAVLLGERGDVLTLKGLFALLLVCVGIFTVNYSRTAGEKQFYERKD